MSNDMVDTLVEWQRQMKSLQRNLASSNDMLQGIRDILELVIEDLEIDDEEDLRALRTRVQSVREFLISTKANIKSALEPLP